MSRLVTRERETKKKNQRKIKQTGNNKDRQTNKTKKETRQANPVIPYRSGAPLKLAVASAIEAANPDCFAQPAAVRASVPAIGGLAGDFSSVLHSSFYSSATAAAAVDRQSNS